MSIAEYVINVLSSVIAVEYMQHGFEKKYTGWRRWLCFAAGCTAYFLVVTCFNWLTGIEGLLSVFYGVVLAVYGIFALKGSLYDKGFLSLMWILIALYGSFSVHGVLGVVTGKNIWELQATSPRVCLYAALAAVAVKFLFGRGVLRFYEKREEAREKEDWLIAGALILLLMAGLLMFRIELADMAERMRYGWLTILLFIQFAGVLFIEQMHRKLGEYKREKIESEFRLKMERQAEKAREENRQDMYRISREINHWRHDMSGKLSVLYYLTKKQQYGEVEEELAKTCREFEKYPELPQETGNEGLDAALIRTVARCREENIRFSYVVMGQPEQIDSMAMGSLMWNLFQNGIEACRALDKERVMEVTVRESAGTTEIRLENSIAGSILEDNPGLQSRKPEQEAHGFGMETIYGVVEAYRGSYVCFEEDGRFVQEIILQHPVDGLC